MSEPYRQPPYPPVSPAEPKSSRKLWIILGVLLGVIVISMGGCLACVSLLGMSARFASDDNSNTLAPGERSRGTKSGGSPPGSSRGTATGLAGGAWGGTLSCDDGDTLPVIIKVSDEGNPVYSYRTKGGDREEEISSVGQTFRFVPPEGGVFTAVVDSLSISEERFSYSTRTSWERSGRTMTQGGGGTSVSAALSGDELEVEVGITSSSSATQPGVIIRGDESTSVCRGKIQKQ